jgi:tRNA (mo5U34)-methyltransferase
MQAVQHDIVARVDNGGHVAGLAHLEQTAEKASGADSSGQRGDHDAEPTPAGEVIAEWKNRVMAADELRAAVEALEWHHSIDLGEGVVTPGRDPSPSNLARLQMPASLAGKTVLDIGAWDGFYSFEAERRGAKRVVAMDGFVWRNESGHPSKAGFEFARRALESGVEDVFLDVMDLSPDRVGGTFDVVLFLGVLYHLRHPLLALENVFKVSGDLLILETHVARLGTRRPAMVFYPGEELDWDETNWWGPNEAAVVEMLRDVGYRRVDVIASRPAVLSVARSVRRLTRARRQRWAHPFTYATGDRIVVHARR